MVVGADLDISYIFLFFGVWFAITGIYYRLPIPIEPMKAIAVIVIACNPDQKMEASRSIPLNFSIFFFLRRESRLL
jgi:hypothetical protein